MPAVRELGRRIKQRRGKAGRSLRDVARKVGKSHAWLSSLEKGLGNPPAEVLTALAEELGDDPAEYLKLAGRVNLAAAHLVPSIEVMPMWARRLEDKIDAISALADDLRGLPGRLEDLDQGQRAIAEDIAQVVDRAVARLRLAEARNGTPPEQSPRENQGAGAS